MAWTHFLHHVVTLQEVGVILDPRHTTIDRLLLTHGLTQDYTLDVARHITPMLDFYT